MTLSVLDRALFTDGSDEALVAWRLVLSKLDARSLLITVMECGKELIKNDLDEEFWGNRSVSLYGDMPPEGIDPRSYVYGRFRQQEVDSVQLLADHANQFIADLPMLDRLAMTALRASDGPALVTGLNRALFDLISCSTPVSRFSPAILISRGADCNATDQGGATPLHYAAQYGQEGVARTLLERGADIKATNQKARPLCTSQHSSDKRESPKSFSKMEQKSMPPSRAARPLCTAQHGSDKRESPQSF